MTVLERRYRRLMVTYPRTYREAHGDELLDILLESADPERTVPEAREAAGLITGGLRARASAAAKGSPWFDGLHLGVTALMAAHLAALLPYAGSIPLWTGLSALALVAVLRGWMLLALPLVLATGIKAVAIASGRPLLDVTLLPVFPDLLTDSALFAETSPDVVGGVYALTFLALLVLAARRGRTRTRSWWWLAAVPPAAWAGPAWMAEGTSHPLSLPRIVLECGVLLVAIWAGRQARDPRWALSAFLYLATVVATVGQHEMVELTNQHLAYLGLLAFLTAVAIVIPYGYRRHALH